MSEEPDESEVELFRTVFANLMSRQKKLSSKYHEDHFLRNFYW